MDTALLIEKLNTTHSLNKDEALQLIKQGAQHKNLLFAGDYHITIFKGKR